MEATETHESQLVKQIDILSFESDEEILEETYDDNQLVFSSLQSLLNPANTLQLSIFINYTLIHSTSEQILFYLITDLYRKGCLIDMKRWAYEIYSTFIVDSAPLQIFNSEENEKIINEIDSKLVRVEAYKPVNNLTSPYDFEMLRMLRDIFKKSRVEAEAIITNQLEKFQVKRRAGLEALYGASAADIKEAKMNRQMMQKIVEKNLMPKLLMFIEDVEKDKSNQEPYNIMLLSALSTVVHQTFSPSINYFESIDQFVSRGRMSIDREICANGHKFVSKVFFCTTYCDFCLKLLYGVSPQGYECNCGIKIHESCINSLMGTCILHVYDDGEDEDENSLNMSRDSFKLQELVHKTLGNQRIENYKRTKGNRPKSDPGLYTHSLDSSSSDDGLDDTWKNDLSLEIPKLTEKERIRREIILELFETERRHVKILKLLNNVFFEPLKRTKALTPELEHILFPSSFFVIKDWHVSFEAMLKKEWHEQHGLLLNIGSCLSIFESTYGNILKESAANFCAGQQVALDALKVARSKNESLQRGLIKAESHKGCRRLQLKDLMLSILQRLTKYPLLFERIEKYTENDDREKIKKAIESSKEILSFVNNAVRNSEELRHIQSKLDKQQFEREAPIEFRGLNLLSYKFVHSGYLIMKKGAQSMRLLLFEKILVLLYKQDERFVLKCCESLKFPVMKIHNVIVRPNATDSRSFFLICQDESASQMIELNALNETDAQNWIQKIGETVEKANNSISLKRRSSAESAQSMLRSESQRLQLTKNIDLSSIAKTLQVQTKYVEEWVQATQKNMPKKSGENTDLCEVDNINVTVNTVNRLISQLSIKIAERDHERELYLKENQKLRSQLNISD